MNVSLPRQAALAAVTASALLLTACGNADGTEEASASSDGLDVVASFYPLEWVASQVAGDRADVSSLTPPGAEAHDLELTPQDVAGVSDADLLVYLGGFQPAVDDAAESQAGDRAWDVTEVADLSLTADGHSHAEGEEHAEDEEHAEGEEPAEEGGSDPHFWVDPARLADVGDALAERLAELDPDGAETYEQNAADLRADLEALDAELADGLADCSIDTLVTSHAAFNYLADRYGFEAVAINGLSPGTEPSAEQTAEISSLVQDRGVTTVYTETLVDPAIAETVASEAGVRTAVLDPLEGLTDESAGEDYLAVMRANLATLQEGQSCS